MFRTLTIPIRTVRLTRKVAPQSVKVTCCLEIALPTKPLQHINDEEGEIALCTLSAFNLGSLESLDDFEEWADLAVRALDSLLDYQDYPRTSRAKCLIS